jgi:hypothetical protein
VKTKTKTKTKLNEAKLNETKRKCNEIILNKSIIDKIIKIAWIRIDLRPLILSIVKK